MAPSSYGTYQLIWDALFAYGYERGTLSLALVDYFALAMLMYVRAQLLAPDYTAGLSPRTLRVPPARKRSPTPPQV